MMSKQKEQGFTLVEIMLVVSIVGLLAALATYGVVAAMNRARIQEATAELNFMSAAVLRLAHDTGEWPNQAPRNDGGSVEIWDISGASVGLFDTDGEYRNWKGPYYEGETLDPWGNPYFFDPDYRVDGVNYAAVGSFGPNGRGRNQYDSDDVYVILNE